MTEIECEFCKSKLSSKYVLRSHLVSNKKCLSIRNLELKTDFICRGCNHVCVDNQKLLNHHESCKIYQRILLTEEYEQKIKDKDKEILDLKYIHSKELENKDEKIKDLQTQLDKMFSTIEKLASQAIDKPNTVTNINNIYSDKYFLEDIKADEVKRKCQTHLTEQVFFAGQRGIAQLCTDHIIKTKDNKVLLTCSDVSRKKFKYVDDIGNMKEDYEARTFTKKVFEPIKQASQIVYENILSDIKEQEEQEDDCDKKSVLSDKTLKAIDCFVQIVNIDNPNGNSDFKNELAILNK